MTMNLTVTEVVGPSSAARMLGISSRHVIRLIEAGKLAATKTEIGRLIPRADVERLAAERSTGI
jgi:excisionase family DNA binding protein